ncbi:MAG: PKD domain-containing protein [Chitinophagaceae bacterium]|nr:PKD domain-containing protein [Chitinophagaceae bacterium]
MAYPATSIHWKLSQVPGIFPNTDSIIAAPVPFMTEVINGRTYYVYTLQQDFTFNNYGTFYLPVAYTNAVIPNCNQTEFASVKIVVNPGPVADFSISPANCLKDTLHFTGTSTTAGFNIASYPWNFDDATTQTTVNASKLFATAGTQNVRYRIYADNGCMGDTTKVLTIHPTPTAVIGASTPICASDSVQISDTSTVATGSISAGTYFGDGNNYIRTVNTPFYHTYVLPGTYTIKLITTSNNGCVSDTCYRSVTVNDKSLAKFGISGNICVRDSIYITDTSSISTGTIVNWRYDFGDGNTLVRTTNTPFYHAYNTAGTFSISLVTVSNLGCTSDTFRRTVTVSDKPFSDFTVSALNCLKDTIDFTHVFPGPFTVTGYLWNFDDATTQTTIDARKRFLTPGVQNIRYRVFANNGCFGDTTKSIIVYNSPTARMGVTTAICADSVLVTDTSSIASGSIVNWRYNFGDGNTVNRAVNTPFYYRYLLPGTYNIWLSPRPIMAASVIPPGRP